MDLIDKLNSIKEKQKQNDKTIQDLNDEILKLKDQESYYDRMVSTTMERITIKKSKTVQIIKCILIILILAVTVGTSILAYYNYPFGEQNHTQLGGETHNWFGMISIWLIHLLISVFSIVIICKRKVVKY